jgi:mono/diheme cytochrome c family protein
VFPEQERDMRRIFPVLMSVFLLLTFSMIFVSVNSHAAADSKGSASKEIDLKAAKATFEKTCSQCHSINRPLGKKKDKAGWEQTVTRMSSYHARRFNGPISEQDQAAIVQYLASVAGK